MSDYCEKCECENCKAQRCPHCRKRIAESPPSWPWPTTPWIPSPYPYPYPGTDPFRITWVSPHTITCTSGGATP